MSRQGAKETERIKRMVAKMEICAPAVAVGDRNTIQLLEHLRAVVAVRYTEKFGHALTWERGWAWEALSFIDNELNKPQRLK